MADGSPAAEAKIEAGVRVSKIAGGEAAGDRAILRALAAAKGSTVKLELRRHPSPDCPAGCGAVDGTEHI